MVCAVPGRQPGQGPQGLLCCQVWGSGERPGLGADVGRWSPKLLDRVRSRGSLRRPLWREEMLGCLAGTGGARLTRCARAASPRPSVLAHQVPNARKLKRKQQLWERLAKQGELPREARRAQARLLNPPAVRAKPGPQDTVERPFYDLWVKDSECPCCRAPYLRGAPCGVALRVFGGVRCLEVAPFSCSCSPFPSGRLLPLRLGSLLLSGPRPRALLPGIRSPLGSESQSFPGRLPVSASVPS